MNGAIPSFFAFFKMKVADGCRLESTDLGVGFGVHDLLGLENDERELLLKLFVFPGSRAVHIIGHSERKVVQVLMIVITRTMMMKIMIMIISMATTNIYICCSSSEGGHGK